MTSLFIVRRALLLGAALGVVGCDIVDLVSNPLPIIEQTWNLPAPSTAVSVASLLPANGSVQILPDSSAFSVTVGGANIARRVGADCPACETMNGTTGIKPAFILTAANSTPLPADVSAAAILNGTVSVQLTNNMSFDPLFVRNNPPTQAQGYMVVVIRSGSLVVGRDSINGATRTFAPGTQLTRNIALTTGTVTNALTFEVTINSPSGDHPVPINANGLLNAVASVPTLNVASVTVNAPSRALTSAEETLDLNDLGDMSGSVVGGALEMTITNPFPITGSVGMRFAYGPDPSQAITKTVTFPTGGTGVRRVQLDSTEMSLLLGNEVAITTTGTVTAAAPITVTPRQAIAIDNRMILTLRIGGEN